MNEPLPADGPERQIMLNALQAYRESCQPPELTPSCPFFTWTANGPACGEQCADLLAVHGVEDAQESLDMGAGIVLFRQPSMLRRRRPRRGPGSHDRPFDASQIYYDDSDRPHADRRTVALIQEFQNLLLVPPPYVDDLAEQQYDLGEVHRQLLARDFDADSLLRFGVGRDLAQSIAVYSALPLIQSEASGIEALEKIDIRYDPEDGWSDFLDVCYQQDSPTEDPQGISKIAYALTDFVIRVNEWMATANIEDILAWRGPVRTAGWDPRPIEVGDDVKETARWLCDRFLCAYESDWDLSSLHLEWLYLHGRRPAPCSMAAMAERKVDASKVSTAIAEATTDRWLRHSSDDQESRASDFVSIALGHLRNEKPELAAAIFETLTYINRSDAEAMNNYGFCLIAFDPDAAVNALANANKLYKSGRLLTIVNYALALHLAGRNDEAYALATSEPTRALPSQRAWLWSLESGNRLRLTTETVDVREYLAGLVRHFDRCCTTGTDRCQFRSER